MNQYYTGRVSQEQVLKEMQRRSAVRHAGYSFIILELVDLSKARVSGVEDLDAKQGDRPGRFGFTKTQKQLEFSRDMAKGGILTAYVLDTESNRKFLASHLDCGYWDIIEVMTGRQSEPITPDSVLEDLYELKNELAAKSKADYDSRRDYLKKIKEESILRAGRPDLLPKDSFVNKDKVNAESLSEEELEAALAKKRSARTIDVKAAMPRETQGQKEAKRKFKLQQKRTARKNFVVNVDISDEEFSRLTPAEKTKVTKARNAAKKQPDIVVTKKPDDIVISSVKRQEEVNAMPNSAFLSPAGMVQP